MANQNESPTIEDGAAHFSKLASLRGRRPRRFNWLDRKADRTPMSERRWFRLTEIADHCAKVSGTVEVDSVRRERTIELLRQAVLLGEFDDTKGRSRVACLKRKSPIATIRFDRESAADPVFFNKAVERLWLSRADCKGWFTRNELTPPKLWKAEPGPSARGRPAEFNWREVEGMLAAEVKKNGSFETLAALLDVAAIFASKHHRDAKTPDQSTVRAAAEKYKWMERFVRR